jgi:hypothetical protein
MPISNLPKLIFFILSLSCLAANAQPGNKTQPESDETQQSTDLKSFNIFGQSGYLIKGEVNNDNFYTFTLIKEDAEEDKEVSFSLRPLTKEAFTTNFFRSLAEFKQKNSASDSTIPKAAGSYDPNMREEDKEADYKKWEEEANKLFYMFVAGSIVGKDLAYEPVAGKICFSDSVWIYPHHPTRNFPNTKRKIRKKYARKFYRRDKRWAKLLLKRGSPEQQFDSINAQITTYENWKKAPDDTKNDTTTPDSEFYKLKEKYNLDMVSGRFERETVFAFYQMCKFKSYRKKELRKKANREYVRKQTKSDQETYRKTSKDLKKVSSKLKEAQAAIALQEKTKKQIDSLKSISTQRQVLIGRKKAARENVDFLISDMENWRNAIDTVKGFSKISTYYEQQFRPSLSNIKDYIQCIKTYPASCPFEKACSWLQSKMEMSTARESAYFTEEFEKGKKRLSAVYRPTGTTTESTAVSVDPARARFHHDGHPLTGRSSLTLLPQTRGMAA